MKFNTVDEKEVEFALGKTKRAKFSKLESKAAKILKSLYGDLFVAQVCLPVYEKKTLPFDFYAASLGVAVEVQGRQHANFIPYFHSSMRDFHLQRKRDADKEYFCELNDLILIHLYWNESEDVWENKLTI